MYDRCPPFSLCACSAYAYWKNAYAYYAHIVYAYTCTLMRSIAEWSERQCKVATFLGSIQVSPDTVESEDEADEAVLNNARKKEKFPLKRPKLEIFGFGFFT